MGSRRKKGRGRDGEETGGERGERRKRGRKEGKRKGSEEGWCLPRLVCTIKGFAGRKTDAVGPGKLQGVWRLCLQKMKQNRATFYM